MEFWGNTFLSGLFQYRVGFFVNLLNLGFLSLSIFRAERIECSCWILDFLRIFQFFVLTLYGLDDCITSSLKFVILNLFLSHNILKELFNTFNFFSPSFESFSVIKACLCVRLIKHFYQHFSLLCLVSILFPVSLENSDPHRMKSPHLLL